VDTDRGAAQLLRQTLFLSAVFRGYERHLAAQGLVDEHGVRAALVAEPSARPLRHVIVTVADRVADPDGLWPVDFTLLSTLPLLERVDVVATEAMLAAGWLERIHAVLPALEEVPVDRVNETESRGGRPTLIVPGAEGPSVFQSRDREDELAQVARRIKAARRAGDTTPLHRHALVVRRPLPHAHGAPCSRRRRAFECWTPLPLAAELRGRARPGARFRWQRLRAGHLRCSDRRTSTDDGARVVVRGRFGADRALSESRYLGGSIGRAADGE
jgi:hypothetical protein